MTLQEERMKLSGDSALLRPWLLGTEVRLVEFAGKGVEGRVSSRSTGSLTPWLDLTQELPLRETTRF
jgi:hypothetical protein